MRPLLGLLGLVIILPAYAEPSAVTGTDTYLAQAGDTKEAATQFCVMYAKQAILDKVGVLLESDFRVRRMETPSGVSDVGNSQMRSFAAAVISIDETTSDYGERDGRLLVNCKVRAIVDIPEAQKQLAAMAASDAEKARLADHQREIESLQTHLAQLETAVHNAASPIAVDRSEMERTVQRINASYGTAHERIVAMTASAKHVESGMTKGEVVNILGYPTRKMKNYWGETGWLYGSTWVLFVGTTVRCVSEKSNTCLGDATIPEERKRWHAG